MPRLCLVSVDDDPVATETRCTRSVGACTYDRSLGQPLQKTYRSSGEASLHCIPSGGSVTLCVCCIGIPRFIKTRRRQFALTVTYETETCDCAEGPGKGPCDRETRGTCQNGPCDTEIKGTCQNGPCDTETKGTCQNGPCDTEIKGTCQNGPCETEIKRTCQKRPCDKETSETYKNRPCDKETSGTCQNRPCDKETSEMYQKGPCDKETSEMCQKGPCDEETCHKCVVSDCVGYVELKVEDVLDGCLRLDTSMVHTLGETLNFFYLSFYLSLISVDIVIIS